MNNLIFNGLAEVSIDSAGVIYLKDNDGLTGWTMDASRSLKASVAAAKIIGGATSLALRNNADSANNVLVSDAGAVTIRAGLTITASGLTITAGDFTVTAGDIVMGTAASQLVGGATSFAIRNNADSADNVLVSNAGVVTIRAGLTVTAGGATITAGDLTVTAGDIIMDATAAQIVGGATSLALRNNADSADNVLVSDAGVVTVRAGLTVTAGAVTISDTAAKIVGGATSLALRNNADSADNVLVSDAGVVTVRAGLVVTAGGATVSAGDLTVTAGDVLFRGGNVPVVERTALTDATVGALTYTAADLLGGLILRDPNGGARSDVSPTAALIVGAVTGAAVGDTFECVLVNTANAAETITFTAGGGVTLIPATLEADQNQILRLIVRLTNVTPSSEAVTIYGMVSSGT